jgi:hypothetical protein
MYSDISEGHIASVLGSKNTLSKQVAEAGGKLVKAITNTNIPVNQTTRRLQG